MLRLLRRLQAKLRAIAIVNINNVKTNQARLAVRPSARNAQLAFCCEGPSAAPFAWQHLRAKRPAILVQGGAFRASVCIGRAPQTQQEAPRHDTLAILGAAHVAQSQTINGHGAATCMHYCMSLILMCCLGWNRCSQHQRLHRTTSIGTST